MSTISSSSSRAEKSVAFIFIYVPPGGTLELVGVINPLSCVAFSKTVAYTHDCIGPAESLLTINLSPSSTFFVFSPSNNK